MKKRLKKGSVQEVEGGREGGRKGEREGGRKGEREGGRRGSPQLLGDGLSLERVDVEAVGARGEDEECDDSDVAVAGLEVVVQARQSLDKDVCPLVGELVSERETAARREREREGERERGR